MNRWTRWLAALGATMMVAACGGGDDDHPPAPTQNIVQIAQGNADFSILVEAVVAAELTGTLSGTTAYTVFAPTNAAFASLLTELGVSKTDLLADKALLTQVLLYHVVPGTVKKAQVPIGTAITTAQGGTFTVGSDLKITDARARQAAITATDILATNGVIHVIDKVILPPEAAN